MEHPRQLFRRQLDPKVMSLDLEVIRPFELSEVRVAM